MQAFELYRLVACQNGSQHGPVGRLEAALAIASSMERSRFGSGGSRDRPDHVDLGVVERDVQGLFERRR